MNLNNVFGYIAKSGAKVAFITGNSNTEEAYCNYDNIIVYLNIVPLQLNEKTDTSVIKYL